MPIERTPVSIATWLVMGGTLIVIASGLLRLTLIQSPAMLIPAFIGLLLAVVGSMKA